MRFCQIDDTIPNNAVETVVGGYLIHITFPGIFLFGLGTFRHIYQLDVDQRNKKK